MKKLFTFLAMLSLLNMVGCAKKASDDSDSSSSDKAEVKLKLSEYTTAKFSPMDLLIPSAYAAVTSVKFCFKRLRFKPEDSDEKVSNVDFELGETEISASGTVLGTIKIPEGTYKRIEFDLEPECGSDGETSVELINDHGSYVFQEGVTIKFEGVFKADDGTLTLGVQAILDALNDYNGSEDMKDILEDASGDL